MSTQALSAGTTDAYLASPSETRFYVVSALVEGHPTVESQAVEVQASGGLPELGSCSATPAEKDGKKTVYRGAFSDSKCTKPSTSHIGKYEWVPGAGTSNGFTATGGKMQLETAGHTVLTCAASTGSGTLTGTKNTSALMRLTGCELRKQRCQGEGAAAGEIEISAVGELGFITGGAKPTVGLALRPAAGGSLFEVSCGETTLQLTGTVISPITTIDKMSGSLSLKLKAKHGMQTPEQFEDGLADTLGLTQSGGTEEHAGLGGTIALTLATPVEIKAVS